MGFLNRRKKNKRRMQAKSHLNWMAGTSYDMSDAIKRLRIAASSCFFGEPMYYHRDSGDDRKVKVQHVYRARLSDRDVSRLRETLDGLDPQSWRGLSPAELMEKAIDEALDADAEATLQEAVRLRSEENIRTTPQVILVRAAHHPSVRGTGLVRRYGAQIIQRADEPAVGLGYQLARYGKPVPNALKKTWRDALQRFDAYQLAKYRLESREVKTVDVVNLVHPKGEALSKLAKGELKITGQTWESIVSAQGSDQAGWEAALPRMGHMALLRNLRNLSQAGVPEAMFRDQLVRGAEKGRQLPFRYYSAYRALQSQKVSGDLLDAVERCLMLSLGNLPHFNGRVMSLCDNSGSARGTTTSSMGTMQVATIGNLTGVLTGMRADDGHLGVFGDRLTTMPIRKQSSVFDQLKAAEAMGNRVGGGTENGIWLFWDEAIRKSEHWDHVFVYSDMQAGHGGLYGRNASDYKDYLWSNGHNIDVPKLVKAYRERVNPNVMVYLVQVAGYQDTIMPEFYDKTFILGGWGDGLLRFAGEMSGLWQKA
ncbi:MAG: TROVE domain-containing protein [Bradymonadia bacterium]